MDFLFKEEIRKIILDKRDSIEPNQKKAWDDMIYTTLINSEFYKKATVIFTFVSFNSEVDTLKFIKHALEDKKVICVPKIKSEQEVMQVFKIDDLSDLKPGYFGIQEPIEKCPKVNVDDINLIIMPGLAFDKKGGRVGYGRGFYDVFLTKINKRVNKIAVAYSLQMIDTVPMNDWDIPIDGVITNEEFIIVNRH